MLQASNPRNERIFISCTSKVVIVTSPTSIQARYQTSQVCGKARAVGHDAQLVSLGVLFAYLTSDQAAAAAAAESSDRS